MIVYYQSSKFKVTIQIPGQARIDSSRVCHPELCPDGSMNILRYKINESMLKQVKHDNGT